MIRIISAINFKGGIGKTTTVSNLGHALARRGKKVVMVDGDRQSNLTTTFLRERVTPSLENFFMDKVPLTDTIYETGRENLFIIPSETNLDHVSTYLSNNPREYYKAQTAFKALENEGIDFILVDHPGASSKLMYSLLEASNEIIIPCILEPYSVIGLRDLFEKLGQELEGHELKNSGIIPYNTAYNKQITQFYFDQLREQFGDFFLADHQVRTDTAVMYAQSQQQTVFEYAEAQHIKSKGASDFEDLASFLIQE